MNSEGKNILDKKRHFLINHGIGLIFIVFIAVLLSLYLLKINEKSILEMVIDYYFNKKQLK